MHLGDQRTGGVDHWQLTLGRQLLDTLGDSVGGEYRHRARGDFVQFVDEHCSPSAQIFHHMAVVHDFVTHIDRRAEFLQRPLDDFDGPLHTGAETAGLGQDDADHRQLSPAVRHMARCTRSGNASQAAGWRRLDGCGNANSESRPFGNTGV